MAKDVSKIAGGLARKEALSPEQRREIASKAAAKRWGKSYTITNKGNFLQDFGIDVDCYVLDDPSKTAVISQRGMGAAIGFSRRGDRLKAFADSKAMDGYIGRDLREKLDNPLIFQRPGAAAGSAVPAHMNGYDATILIDICQAILNAKADGKLSAGRYDKMIAQAQILLGASAKNGIRGLVYALAGYNPSSDKVITAFKVYVQEEAKKYEAEFPNELYAQWHRLYDIPVHERGKPWQFKHLTINHIYTPLARSNGKILELTRALKAKSGDRNKKLFQFLNDVGTRALRMHLGRVLEMSESSTDRAAYERRVVERFGGQPEFDFAIGAPSSASQPPSLQSPTVSSLSET